MSIDTNSRIMSSYDDNQKIRLSLFEDKANTDFHAFTRGYFHLLRENLQEVTGMDQRDSPSQSYYTYTQDHDRRKPNWKPSCG